MMAHYHIDTEKFSLEKFKNNIKTRDMIPSRVILKEDLDERFDLLDNTGISTLKDLIETLKSKAKIDQFSTETGLSVQYLTILVREAKSYLPNPIRLNKFVGVPGSILEKLEDAGIKNTRHLFNNFQDKADREKLAQQTGIPTEILDELFGLSDLTRVYGVGPVFARMIYDLGIISIQDFVSHSAEEFIEIYETKTKKKADFGVNEIEFSLEMAKVLEIAGEI
jgi:predicted flap endonuclease-1-like 5' DNA nuclease